MGPHGHERQIVKGVRFAESLTPLLVPLSTIQQHPSNPNNGNLEVLIESIQVNGFTTALTVDAQTGNILAGNHRYQALHALGATHAPVIWIDNPKDGGKRILMADNRTGQLAKMDEDQAVLILQELARTEDGLVGTGWEDMDVNELINKLAEEQDIPMGGFGTGDPAPLGIYQVVIQFDNPSDRDEAFATIIEQYEHDNGKVRSVDL